MIIIEFLNTWAPVLVSVLGIATTVILAVNRVKDALVDLSKDRKAANTATENSIKANQALQAEYTRLAQDVELLLDQMTRIKDFAEVTRNDQNH